MWNFCLIILLEMVTKQTRLSAPPDVSVSTTKYLKSQFVWGWCCCLYSLYPKLWHFQLFGIAWCLLHHLHIMCMPRLIVQPLCFSTGAGQLSLQATQSTTLSAATLSACKMPPWCSTCRRERLFLMLCFYWPAFDAILSWELILG